MSIRVATNFSSGATEASRIAANFARALYESLKIVHVLNIEGSASDARDRIAKARTSLVSICPNIETDVLAGPVAETLASEVARSRRAMW